jgi:cyclopropane-fatty-acyl-phospholipid synthase
VCERYPRSRVLALSNSRTQRAFIEAEARRRGLTNLEVVTCDVNQLGPMGPFDRIVSVEMFEHLWNTDALLERLAAALTPDGRLFVHIFSHARFAYPFEDRGRDDWMARTFFTGGSMLSDDALLYGQEHLRIEDHWFLDGSHYARTAEAWLARFDTARATLAPVLAATYGADQVARWTLYWRLFFLACSEMFGYRRGQEWGISHYRFRLR